MSRAVGKCPAAHPGIADVDAYRPCRVVGLVVAEVDGADINPSVTRGA